MLHGDFSPLAGGLTGCQTAPAMPTHLPHMVMAARLRGRESTKLRGLEQPPGLWVT